jgi:dUTP pyrophosphatase
MFVKIARVGSSSSDILLPAYQTGGAAGMDLCAAIRRKMVIRPGKTVLVPTGFSIELPAGYEAQIRPRSGLASNHSIGILNSPGTIDSDYRGEIKVILTNFGKKSFVVHRGDRIAQMVVAKYARVTLKEVKQLKSSRRGRGGFGHSGLEMPKSSR